ncbi:MAG: DUF1501 domain-containing protein [Pyrinomonadaceae bacterium]
MKETRRDFIKKTGGCALGMVSLATQMQHLGAMSAMAQKVIDTDKTEGTITDYKALVLLYWAGGNDGNNMIIPNHSDATISNWATYSALRTPQASGGLAFTQAQLLPIAVPSIGGLTYGFHPNLGPQTINGTTIVNNGIHDLYLQGDLAVVANVGTLARPMTKAQYQNNSVQKPYQLFSHSDQVNQSQTSVSNTQAFTGWGGRLSDRMNSTFNQPGGLIPMVTSIAGAQLFTAGQLTLPMAIGQANTGTPSNLTTVLTPAGLSGTNATVVARKNAFNALRTMDLDSNYIDAASNVTDLAMQANDALQTSQDVTTLFPNTSLGLQLKQVARLIKSKDDLNISRQVFYVQVGSFDTHTTQITSQANLLTSVSQAMRSFWDEMGVQGNQNNVTTFTLSDFNRTMNPAGVGGSVGSDHAWGNHMFVMGGAVNGGDFYGSRRFDGSGNLYPTLVLAGPDDIDGGTAPRGRWLPTTSVEQYAVRLARWFGLAPGDEASVFPNLSLFSDTNTQLNFMQ